MVLRIVGNARSAKGLGERLRVKQEASFYAFTQIKIGWCLK